MEEYKCAFSSTLIGSQFGGLLGLQHQLDGAAGGSIGNIEALIGHALEKHGSLDAIPCHLSVEDMISFQVQTPWLSAPLPR